MVFLLLPYVTIAGDSQGVDIDEYLEAHRKNEYRNDYVPSWESTNSGNDIQNIQHEIELMDMQQKMYGLEKKQADLEKEQRDQRLREKQRREAEARCRQWNVHKEFLGLECVGIR